MQSERNIKKDGKVNHELQAGVFVKWKLNHIIIEKWSTFG